MEKGIAVLLLEYKSYSKGINMHMGRVVTRPYGLQQVVRYFYLLARA